MIFDQQANILSLNQVKLGHFKSQQGKSNHDLVNNRDSNNKNLKYITSNP